MIATEKFAAAVEEAVARIEKRTDAEIIVVAAGRSGSYRDVAMAIAAVLSLGLLIGLIFAPFDFHPVLVIGAVAVAFPLLTLVFDRSTLAAALATEARRSRQVREAAEAEFLREAVHGTPHRTGVLLYFSAVEGRAELILDLGAAGMIAPGELVDVRDGLHHADVAGFIVGLHRLGDLLEKRIPHLAISDDFDLPNAPRIRL
jgi:putative membrane protein